MSRVIAFKQAKKHCPVCGMVVSNVKENDLWRTYRGSQYVFCTQQCVDRFVGHPGLYVGNPKTGKSEKQKGRVELKCHQLVFSQALSPDCMTTIIEAIGPMMGITRVKASDKALTITYDLIVVSLEDIEHAIVNAVGERKTPLWESVKRRWIEYTEACELDNLAHPTKENGCH